MKIASIGIDIGKTTFHLVGLDERGSTVVRKKFSRNTLLAHTAKFSTSLIGIEACGGSHYLARCLREQGHEVRLIPPQFVKPYRKSNKNDYLDAEAIAEAVTRKNMRFVPIKTEDQLDLQGLHRVRERLVHNRTEVINQVRGFLQERGMTFNRGPASLRKEMPSLLEDADQTLTPRLRVLLDHLWQEWKHLDSQIERMSEAIDVVATAMLLAYACARSQESGRWFRPQPWLQLATGRPSDEDETSPPGWDWYPNSTRPEARPSCWVSPSAATFTCARCSCTEHAPCCCASSTTPAASGSGCTGWRQEHRATR